ncbi:LTA synthase family protein [Acetivibrio cellulolyticus]|uniref:LTA synthase family protein n=1 Tax=Acetivibrio cellulolyticus TaxID=35830 RepID=UPI0001E2E784|nr:LTA synthase family protein [Acetivibrio cellulolyticus]
MNVSLERIKTNPFADIKKQFNLFDFIYIIFFAGAILCKAVFMQFQAHISFRPLFSKINMFMTLSSIGFVLILFSILFIFYSRNKVLFLIANIFLSVFLFADAMYFRYYNTIISVPVISNARYLGEVGGSAVSLLRKSDILYFFDLPLFLLYPIIFRKKALKSSIFSRLIISIVAFALGVTSFAIARNQNDSSVYDNNYMVKNLGIGYFHYFDTKRFLAENLRDKSLSSQEKQDIKEHLERKSENSSGSNYNGIAKGKNLIVVQVEALQQFVVGLKINGKEVTPNLNKLVGESAYFNNIYVQVAGGNTSDAEFMTNNSLYAAKEGTAYFRFATNDYYSLPKALKDSGYSSYAAHAYTPSFWNRTEMYKAIGFDKFISSNDFVMDEYIGWGGWALSDDSFYRQTLGAIDKSKPFYSFLITLSSHHPYSYFDDKKTFDVGAYDKTYLGNYLKAQNYADAALGRFIEKLKEQGLYDNSLLVIYGDHYGLPKAQAGEDLIKLLNVSNSKLDWGKLQKVPVFMHCSGLKSGVVEKTGGQVDIYPTIMNLMGLDHYYGLGKDLFNCNEGYAVLRNSSVVTGDFFYFSDENKVYDFKSGQQLNKASYDKKIGEYQEDLRISDLILEKNAYGKMKFDR